MSLMHRLKAIYPTLTDRDFMAFIRLQDDSDGRGPFIARWEHPTLKQPSPEQIKSAADQPDIIPLVSGAVQERLDSWAQSRGYDSIVSLCSYATSPHPRFGREGRHGVDRRDGHWQKCLDIIDAVQLGKRPIPTTLEEVMAEMPPLDWPA